MFLTLSFPEIFNLCLWSLQQKTKVISHSNNGNGHFYSVPVMRCDEFEMYLFSLYATELMAYV